MKLFQLFVFCLCLSMQTIYGMSKFYYKKADALVNPTSPNSVADQLCVMDENSKISDYARIVQAQIQKDGHDKNCRLSAYENYTTDELQCLLKSIRVKQNSIITMQQKNVPKSSYDELGKNSVVIKQLLAQRNLAPREIEKHRAQLGLIVINGAFIATALASQGCTIC